MNTESRLNEIFIKKFSLDFEKINDKFKEEILLGKTIGLSASDLLYLHKDIEQEFNIIILAEHIENGMFFSFNRILFCLNKQLNDELSA